MTRETWVVKLGGELLVDPAARRRLMTDLVALRGPDVRLVIVHGGGPQADALARSLGHEPRKVQGRRITTDTDLAIARYLYGGALNLDILADLAALGVSGLRVSGVDGDLLRAVRRPPVVMPGAGEEPVDFGHVGDVTGVNPAILELLLGHGHVPVVSPLAHDGQGSILNVNADTVATTVARALKASRLVLLTGVPGVLDAGGRVIPHLDRPSVERLIAGGVLTGGMIPKVRNALEGVEAGIGAVHVLDVAGLPTLTSPAPAGTMIVAAPEDSRG